MMVNLRVTNLQDLLCGLFFVAIGVFGLWVSHDYPVGTAMNMNTGYLPRLLCWFLIFLGAIVASRGFVTVGQAIGPWPWRPFLVIMGGVAVFGYAIAHLGLFLAAVLLTVIGSHAEIKVRYKEVAIIALVMAVGAGLIFVYGLGLPIMLWPRF